MLLQSMQVQSMPGTGEHLQTRKNPFTEITRDCETKKILTENPDTPSYTQKISILKLSETHISSTTNLFGTSKQKCLMKTHDTSVSHSFLVTETFRKSKTDPHEFFSGRQEEFDNFL